MKLKELDDRLYFRFLVWLYGWSMILDGLSVVLTFGLFNIKTSSAVFKVILRNYR